MMKKKKSLENLLFVVSGWFMIFFVIFAPPFICVFECIKIMHCTSVIYSHLRDNEIDKECHGGEDSSIKIGLMGSAFQRQKIFFGVTIYTY